MFKRLSFCRGNTGYIKVKTQFFLRTFQPVVKEQQSHKQRSNDKDIKQLRYETVIIILPPYKMAF